MADLSRYREQHAALVKGIGAIQRLAGPAELSTRAPELLRLLMELAGQLKLHLALEDESLYPKLVKATDPKTAESARRFQREMGGLRGRSRPSSPTGRPWRSFRPIRRASSTRGAAS